MEKLFLKGTFTAQAEMSLDVFYEYLIMCLSPLKDYMLE